ncbi:MAG: sigma 54-interacting transcriptional regulator, partial [Myxococcales bacterium]|nr:sigma 54-interacting transcriptional regulator [Myxococcales bacterium]
EDLGSTNGTFVHGERLAPGAIAYLAPGGMFELGSTMFLVQGRHAQAPRRVLRGEALAARVDEAWERGEAFFAVRMRVLEKKDPKAPLHDVMLGCLRGGDVLGALDPRQLVALVFGPSRDEAEALAERLTSRAKTLGVTLQATVDVSLESAVDADTWLRGEATSPAEEPTPIVLASEVMRRLHTLVERVAASEVNVLLLGETGVGKEIFAERVHAGSARASGPLVRLNCAALPGTLLESELFGHERGAFTGATATKPGLLEIARGGTVFLDEVGDMAPPLQAKLLRVLEERVVRRVGALESRPIDVRVVSATCKDLEAEVKQGRFRQDLFFRLQGVAIVVPPLRERREVIEPLTRAFVRAACRQQDRAPLAIAPEVFRALLQHEWPGNLRELRNVAERAVALCGEGTIELSHLPAELSSVGDEGASALKANIKGHERQLILDALLQADGNQTRAAKLLGISRRTLISRIEEHGLPRPRKKS